MKEFIKNKMTSYEYCLNCERKLTDKEEKEGKVICDKCAKGKYPKKLYAPGSSVFGEKFKKKVLKARKHKNGR